MKRTIAIGVAVAALAVSQGVAARTQACHRATEAQVAGLFDRWNASLKTLDAEKVADNYAARSILLPTLSNTPRTTREARLDYFHHFLERKPQGRIDQRMIHTDCNSAVDAGLYTFTFGDGSEVKARYTYTYAWRSGRHGGKWLITSHHSSVMPEK